MTRLHFNLNICLRIHAYLHSIKESDKSKVIKTLKKISKVGVNLQL
jgi:hypothetical protein